MAIGIASIVGGITKGLLGSGKKPPKPPEQPQSGQQMAQKMLPPADYRRPDYKPGEGYATGGAVPTTAIVPVAKPKVSKTGNANLDGALENVAQSAANLEASLKSFVGFKKGQAEKKRKAEVIAKRNMLGAAAGAVAGAAYGLVRKPAQNFLEMFKRFVYNVALGSLVGFLVEQYETIKKIVGEVLDAIEPVWNALKDWVLVPVWNFIKWTVGEGTKLVKQIAAFPPVKAGMDAVADKLKEFEDLFPDFERDINKVRNTMNLDDLPPMQQPGATPSGSSYAPGAGKRATGAVASTTAQTQVKKAGFEQKDFELYRDVVANIESKGKYDIQGGSGDMYAGRYQMGAAARQDAARLLGETYQGDSEAARKRFREDPEMQERYFAAYTRANHNYLMSGSPEYRSLSREGKLQVLGYAHNAGWSRARDWLKDGMSESFEDGFGTRSDKYSTEIRAAQQSGSNPLDNLPPMQQPAYSSGGSGTFINPTPQTNLKQQKGGYAADTGLDIHGNIGDPIVSPVSGTLEYAEAGHTTQANQDSDPTKPGKQPQYSFRIKLDKPVTINGKTVRFVYGTHLASLDPAVANKSGIKIRQGQRLGTMGQANNVPHLHLGLVGDRRQTEFLNFKEVDAALGGRYSSDPTPTRPDTRAQSVSTTPSYQRPKPKIIPVPIDNTPPMQQKPAGATSTRSLNRSERRNRNAALYKS